MTAGSVPATRHRPSASLLTENSSTSCTPGSCSPTTHANSRMPRGYPLNRARCSRERGTSPPQELETVVSVARGPGPEEDKRLGHQALPGASADGVARMYGGVVERRRICGGGTRRTDSEGNCCSGNGQKPAKHEWSFRALDGSLSYRTEQRTCYGWGVWGGAPAEESGRAPSTYVGFLRSPTVRSSSPVPRLEPDRNR